MYPLTFTPILSPKPWGGHRLSEFGKGSFGEPIGESWEVSDLENAPSAPSSQTVIAAGEFAGKTLSELQAGFEGELGWSGRFPLLIKLLDANQHLSVQVHPDAAYVARHTDSHLKTESWYVVSANPDSVMFIGFRRGVTAKQVDKALGTPAIVDLLQPVPAHVGDIHHLPAGTIHSLGAGVLVAEVQTPSDTTFRIYDWASEYGREPRPLHIADAIATLEIAGPPPNQEAQLDLSTRLLIETEHYWIVERRPDQLASQHLESAAGFRVLMVIDGTVTVTHKGSEYGATRGGTMLLPASITSEVTIEAEVSSIFLEIGVP